MGKFDWKALVGTVAPTLAMALGGPLAGVAVRELSQQLLGKPDAAPDEIEAALAVASPDTLAKIREADRAFESRMKELDIDLERVHAADRDSARRMQIATKDPTPMMLAVFVTLGFFGVLGWMLVYGMAEQGKDALLVMLGSLGTAWVNVIAFYFGSSAGSKAKTDAMANLGRKA